MDLWLSHNSHCPACRVAITADNPCRPVIGETKYIPSTNSHAYWQCVVVQLPMNAVTASITL